MARRYFMVADTHNNIWGTGLKASTALNDANKNVKRYLENRLFFGKHNTRAIKLGKAKEITKDFYNFISDNGGEAAEIKRFKGIKY